MAKGKKKYCPAKRQNHEEFYRDHPEHRGRSKNDYWIKFFSDNKKVN